MGRGSLTIPPCRDWQDDKCLTNVLGGISTLGIDWATRSCLKLLNIPELISKTLKGETLIKNVCIAVKDSPFWGNSKKFKKVHVFVPLCIQHWNSLRTWLWLPRRIRFLTYYSLKVVSLQKNVWGMTEEIPYWWQVATQIWVSKDSDWLCNSCGWEICFNLTETGWPYSSDIIFTCISVPGATYMQAVSFWNESKIGMHYRHLLDFILDLFKHTVREHILFS